MMASLPRRTQWRVPPAALAAAIVAASGLAACSSVIPPTSMPSAPAADGSPAASLVAPPTAEASRAWTFQTTASGPIVHVVYALPPDLELAVGEYGQYFAITSGAMSGGFKSRGLAEAAGIRIVDVTTARPHYNGGRPLGDDAASFISGMATNPRVPLSSVSPVSRDRLAGMPAWSIDMTGPDGELVHLDAVGGSGGLGLSIDLAAPSRLIAVDIGSVIVLVQVWAGPDRAFKAWVADAQPILDSLRLEVTNRGA